MGLITKEVEVTLSSNSIKYYEDLGYEIPRYKDKWNRIKTPRGTKILTKVEDLPKNSHIKLLTKCDCCGKEYIIRYQDYYKHNHNGKTYCKKCGAKIFKSGEKHPKWNYNKTDEERERERKYPEYVEFIKRVLARDNYTCKCCGKESNGDIEVHHLDGYNWCVERRTDETNGIALCEKCHKNFHSIYGYGGNTREQFEEWIEYAIGELKKYNGELPTARKIYCIEEDKIYDSVEQLTEKWNVKSIQHIYHVCNHDKTKKGYYIKSVKGKHLLWLDEYEKCTEEDIKRYLDWCEPNKNRSKGELHGKSKTVICITTGEIFKTIKEAKAFYGINNISACCRKKISSAGKLEDGTPLQWQYYEDYLKEQNEKLQESA